MFENQKILLRRNNSNNITKPQKINISNPKEKEMNNYVKNKSILIFQVWRSVLKELFFRRSQGWNEYCGKN